MPRPTTARRLHWVCAAAIVAAAGCKTTPPALESFGEAVDGATKKVVSAASDTFGRQDSLPPPVEGEEEAIRKSREAYKAGKLAYETAQFIEAVERFLESFALAEDIENGSTRAQVKSTLLYNLGQAHIRAYDLDGDKTRLTQAVALLQSHLDGDPNLSDEEREQARKLIATAEAKLADANDVE